MKLSEMSYDDLDKLDELSSALGEALYQGVRRQTRDERRRRDRSEVSCEIIAVNSARGLVLTTWDDRWWRWEGVAVDARGREHEVPLPFVGDIAYIDAEHRAARPLASPSASIDEALARTVTP